MKINGLFVFTGLMSSFRVVTSNEIETQHEYVEEEKPYGGVEFGTKECKACKYCDTCLNKLPSDFHSYFDLTNEDLTSFCCVVSAMAFTCLTGIGVAAQSNPVKNEKINLIKGVLPSKLVEIVQSKEMNALRELQMGISSAEAQQYLPGSSAAQANEYIRDIIVKSSGMNASEVDMEIASIVESDIEKQGGHCYAYWVEYYPYLEYLASLFEYFYPVCHCHARFNLGCSLSDFLCDKDCGTGLEMFIWELDAHIDAFVEDYTEHGFLLRQCNGCPGTYYSSRDSEYFKLTGGMGGKPYEDCFMGHLLVVTLIIKYFYY